jgi:hypothetical protein
MACSTARARRDGPYGSPDRMAAGLGQQLAAAASRSVVASIYPMSSPEARVLDRLRVD